MFLSLESIRTTRGNRARRILQSVHSRHGQPTTNRCRESEEVKRKELREVAGGVTKMRQHSVSFIFLIVFSLFLFAGMYERRMMAQDLDLLRMRVNQMEDQSSGFRALFDGIRDWKDKKDGPPAARVTVTCYRSRVEETDSTPNITAFNWRTGPGLIAVSRDLLEKGFVPGQKVYLEGYGVFEVGDVMNKRFKRRVDIWVPDGTKPFMAQNVLLVVVVMG
ncbi:MAG: hypothetical protein AB1640_22525 [bacterium]